MDLSDWRARIDGLDLKILALLNERAEYVLQLAPLKRQKEMPIEEPQREAAIRANLSRHNQGPLSDDAVCRIFEAIIGVMKAVQEDEMTRERRQVRKPSPAGRATPKRSQRANLK
jgi:chorismate mutase